MSNNHCIREALELQCNNLETEAERLQASLDAIATILPNWRESEAKFWERLQTIAAEAAGGGK